MSWADTLGAMVEAAWAADPQHPGSLWLSTRGAPVGSSGIGVGVEPPPDAPDVFRAWAAAVGWDTSVVVVLRDFRGVVTAFQARAVTDKRYLTFEVYNSHVCPLIWGADVAIESLWSTGHLTITEGAFDALGARLAGATSVIATLGAKPGRLTQRWVERLAKRLTVLYDMDDPGRAGAQRWAQDLRDRAIVSIPAYHAHDPWDLWVDRPAALRALVS